jgi:hypothetical protein
MKQIRNMNIGELAAFICTYLKKCKIDCVLTGGACVSIYTNNKYASFDLDFIDRIDTPRKIIKNALLKIGFTEKNRYFVHPDTKFFVEFPAGPLSVGYERVNKVDEIVFKTGRLTLLTPTDCIKDRLAAYYHWDDLQSLEQAVLVAKEKKINITVIRKWSKNENQSDKFNIFKKRILV